MKKRLIALVMTVLTVMSLAACGSSNANETTQAQNTEAQTTVAATTEDDFAYVTANGKMVIGITIYEPMNYYDSNNTLVGFDTEYAQAVCEKLGLEAEFIEINWDTKEVELDAKSIDCIWNGLTITEERKANMEFSNPYIKNMQVVVVKNSNAAKFVDTDSLKSAVISAEAGSAGEGAIKDDANLSQATYVSVGKQTDALMEVKAGTSDAAVLDFVLAAAMIGEGTDYSDLTTVEGLELAVEEYGVGFRKGSNLAEKVNEATAELIADGTLAALAEKYDLSLQLIANQQ